MVYYNITSKIVEDRHSRTKHVLNYLIKANNKIYFEMKPVNILGWLQADNECNSVATTYNCLDVCATQGVLNMLYLRHRRVDQGPVVPLLQCAPWACRAADLAT